MPDVFDSTPASELTPGIPGDVEILYVAGVPTIEVVQSSEPTVEITGFGQQGPPGPPGSGVLPPGGVAGQYLVKMSSAPEDAEWMYFPVVLVEEGEDPNPLTTPYGSLVVEKVD